MEACLEEGVHALGVHGGAGIHQTKRRGVPEGVQHEQGLESCHHHHKGRFSLNEHHMGAGWALRLVAWSLEGGVLCSCMDDILGWRMEREEEGRGRKREKGEGR